jgi:hypothetical protein
LYEKCGRRFDSLALKDQKDISYSNGGLPAYAGEVGKTAPIKKAAANAAAKVRRWIKELQINVSEHRGDKPNLRFI